MWHPQSRRLPWPRHALDLLAQAQMAKDLLRLLRPTAAPGDGLQPEILYNTTELQRRGDVVCGHFCSHMLAEGEDFDDVVLSLLING